MIPVECVDGPLKGDLIDLEVEGSTYIFIFKQVNLDATAEGYPVDKGRRTPIPIEYRAALFRAPDRSEYMVYTSALRGGSAEEAIPDWL